MTHMYPCLAPVVYLSLSFLFFKKTQFFSSKVQKEMEEKKQTNPAAYTVLPHPHREGKKQTTGCLVSAPLGYAGLPIEKLQ